MRRVGCSSDDQLDFGIPVASEESMAGPVPDLSVTNKTHGFLQAHGAWNFDNEFEELMEIPQETLFMF